MEAFLHFARNAAICLAVTISGEAIAQTASANLKAGFDLQFDCERPFFVRNHPIHAVFTGVLNANKSASADLAITGVFFTNTVHFDARLGAVSQPAPGGTSSLRVMARNRLRAIWDLPNNQYSMFDGSHMYYCSKQRLLRSSCEAH